jgi:hypothetical protein
VVEGYAKPLARVSPLIGMILLVSFFFGLIFGVIYFAGLLVIVLPWLQLIG